MKRPLPERPNLAQLKAQAKTLLKSFRSNEPEALRRVAEVHPRFRPGAVPPASSPKIGLADAQLVIAREHGFESWPRLKHHVEELLLAQGDPIQLFHDALRREDAGMVRKLFARFPEYKARINENPPGGGRPVITQARTPAMLDALLEAGADLNAKTNWWAGGFGVLHTAPVSLARHAIKRGAHVDIHAAARLGMLDRVRELLAADPSLVHARGGDGQTPLHFASTVEIAGCLLDHGADIDARDVDHESTPAQYMLRERPGVARYLISRGCETDLLMAAALGDMELMNHHLEADPRSIRVRVSEEFFPMVGGRSGGTIYQWVLGWHVSPHQVARKFGQHAVFEELMRRSPEDVRFVNACWLGEEPLAREILARNASLIDSLAPGDIRQVAHAARNNELEAVRLMLELGWPVETRGQHGGTPLHWAAWHGNVRMAKAILAHKPPLELKDRDFAATPSGWAIHASLHGWGSKGADYPGLLELLLAAGARPPEKIDGSAAVQAFLRSIGLTGQAGDSKH